MRAALTEAASRPTGIKEVILQQAIYCGLSAAHHAMAVARNVMDVQLKFPPAAERDQGAEDEHASRAFVQAFARPDCATVWKRWQARSGFYVWPDQRALHFNTAGTADA